MRTIGLCRCSRRSPLRWRSASPRAAPTNECRPSRAAAARAGGTTQEAAELSGNIAGAGASSQEAAHAGWIAGFQDANPDATVSYDPVGSGGGREQFVAGGTAFGGTDSHLADEELTGAQERCGGAGQPDRDPGLHLADRGRSTTSRASTNLQLSPETLAKIFKQEITNWNDPAIAADNPDATLPDQRITAVNRSDESGTTENFTEYLAARRPGRLDVRGQRRLAGQGRRGRAGHLRRRRRRQGRQGRDRLRRRQPGRRARHGQDQGRRRVRRPDARGRRQDRRDLQGDRRPGHARVHVRRSTATRPRPARTRSSSSRT